MYLFDIDINLTLFLGILLLAKAVAYPMDPDLVVNLYKGIEWRHYKEEMMTSIPKSRWPKRLDDLEPFLTGP